MTPPVRGARREVRNPLLGLAAARRLRELPEPVRFGLADLLQELAADANSRAQACWSKHKAPMAAYWKACAVYSRHLARVLRSATSPLHRL